MPTSGAERSVTMPDRDDPVAELFATGALVLLLGAVIAAVVGAVELGRGSVMTATIVWVAAVVGLVVSLGHFMANGERAEAAPADLPFPSWLRNEADA